MSNNHQIFSVWIIIIVHVTRHGLVDCQRKLVFVEKTKTWYEAHDYCKDNFDGALATYNILEKLGDKLQNCYSSSVQYWIGNIEVVTPYISLRACIQPIFNASRTYDDIDMTVEQCAAHCADRQAFEIQGNSCRCHSGDENVVTVDALECNTLCKNQRTYCGGKDASNYYTFYQGFVRVPHFGGNCMFASCKVTEETTGQFELTPCPCDGGEVFENLLFCSTSVNYTERDVSDWMDACSECIATSSSYPISGLNSTLCSKLCPEGSFTKGCGRILTSTRKYEGNIYAERSTLRKFEISSCDLVTFDGSVLQIYQASPCYNGERHKFLCVTDRATEGNGNELCFVDIEEDSKEDISTSRTDTTTSRTTTTVPVVDTFQSTGISFSTRSSLPNSTGSSKPSSTSSPEPNSTLSSDINDALRTNSPWMSIVAILVPIIIVLVVGGSIALTIIIIRKRRGQQKKGDDASNPQHTPSGRLSYHQNSVYMDAKEDEYDELHTRRNQVLNKADKETQFYDHVTNPQQGKTDDNTYDEMLKSSPEGDVDDTYSHAKSNNSEDKGGFYDISHQITTYDSCTQKNLF